MKISGKMNAFALKTSLCVALAIFVCCQHGNAQNSNNAVANAGIAPMGQSQSYQYLFFSKDDDAKTRNLLQMTQQEVEKMGTNVGLKQIAIKDPTHAKLVEQYGVSRAPMPLVLCVAATGACVAVRSVYRSGRCRRSSQRHAHNRRSPSALGTTAVECQ